MTDIREPLLLSDRPVGQADDRLWNERPFRRQLERVAKTFAEPLARGRSMPSLTVAVLGPWGAGKSSALRILRDRAAEIALASGEGGAASDGAPVGTARPASQGAPPKPRLVICDYSAPVWQATKLDARTTLVARMLVSLAGGVENAAEQLFLPAKAVLETVSKTAQPSSVEGRLLWSSAAVERIATVLSRLQDFDELLRLQLAIDAANPAETRALVVLIDDLDRCEPAFVHELLNETQQLGRVPNVFFVVAADEDTLRRAVKEGAAGRERTDAEVDHELAKLVQHTITVPDLDEATATLLLRSLLVAEPEPAVADALLDNVGVFLQGLPSRTPRAVKRALNSLGSEMAGELAAARARGKPSRIDVQKHLKRMLLARTWDDFFTGYFVPLGERGLAHERQPLVMLQDIVPRLGAENATDRRILHELGFLCDEFPYLPWRSLPVALVRFLGTPPLLLDLAPPLALLAAQPVTERPPRDGASTTARPPADGSTMQPPPLPPRASPGASAPPRPPPMGSPGASAPPRVPSPMSSPEPPPRGSFPSSGFETAPVTRGTIPPPPDTRSFPDPTAGGGPDDFTDPTPPLPPPATVPEGPDEKASPGAPDELFSSAIQRTLDAALAAVRALPDEVARLRRAAQAAIELAPEEPASDAPAMALAHGLLPLFIARAAASPSAAREALPGQLLARHVELLRRHGLHGTAGRILYDAFGARLPGAESIYAAYLIGAGAMDAARSVSKGEPVDYRAHLRDAPDAERELLPSGTVRDILAAIGASPRPAG